MSIGILSLAEKLEVTLISDNQVLSSETFEKNENTLDKIFALLQPNGVTQLKVMSKPVIIESASKYESCGVLEKSAKEQFLVISQKDIGVLKALGRALGVEKVELYKPSEYYKELSEGNFVVIDETIDSQLAMLRYSANGLEECFVCTPQSLKQHCIAMKVRHGVEVFVNGANTICKTTEMTKTIANYSSLPSEVKGILSSSLITLLKEPTLILETNGETEAIPVAEETLRGKLRKARKEESVEKIVKKQQKQEQKKAAKEYKQELDDGAVAVEESNDRFAVNVLNICLGLFAVVFGVQLAIVFQLSDDALKIRDLNTQMLEKTNYLTLHDAYLSDRLTAMRSGTLQRTAKLSAIENADFPVEVKEVKFFQDQYTIVAVADSLEKKKEAEKIAESLGTIINLSELANDVKDDKNQYNFAIVIK